MPKIKMNVPHTLGQEAAAERLKSELVKLKETYKDQINELDEAWDGDTCTFRLATLGVTIKGNVATEPEQVRIEASLPLMAMPFRGKIEEQIRQELGKVLA